MTRLKDVLLNSVDFSGSDAGSGLEVLRCKRRLNPEPDADAGADARGANLFPGFLLHHAESLIRLGSKDACLRLEVLTIRCAYD